MKRFKGFVIKEFYHIFRDKRTLIVLFGMPIVQLLLFGFVVTNEIKDARIAILDLSKDEVTRDISLKLLSSGYFLLDKNLSSMKEVDKVFKEGNVKEVIVFEENFGSRFKKEGKAHLQIIADAAEPNTANLLVNYTQGIVASYVQRLNMDKASQPLIITEIRMMYNPELKGVFMFVPGIIAMLLMLISALMTSISITREKELGTMEILLASPLKPVQIIIGKVTPYMLLSFVNVIIILLVGNFVFGVPIMGSSLLLLAESVLYILTALSLGILISTITASQQVAMMLSMVGLMLPTVILSGFIFPIENMPIIMQYLCQLMPPKWFIVIIKSIMLKGNGFEYVWKETLVLVIMTIFFLIMSAKKFKIRLD